MPEKKISLWKAIFQRKMMICILNGFTAGLPLFYLLQMVPAWLKDSKVAIVTIGFFGLVQIPYTWKFLWSPLLDRFTPPLGRRRGWMMITQVALMLSMIGMGFLDPTANIWYVAYCAVGVAVFSATQDITLDAYRRELLTESEFALGSAMYANAYRIAGFIPGGIALVLADHIAWGKVHIIVGLFMLVGIFQTLWIPELPLTSAPPKNLYQTVVGPFREFFKRTDVKSGLLILGFMFFYKFGDVLATSLQTPFFKSIGFTNSTIGVTAKSAGVISMLVGGTIGGMVIFRIGLNRSLWVFGILQALAIVSFAVLSRVGPIKSALAVAMSMEYFATGLGTAALMAFMGKETSKAFTATQFALFSSLTATPRALAGPLAGILVEGFNSPAGTWITFIPFTDIQIFSFHQSAISFAGLGWTKFFFVCMVLAVPGLVLLHFVAPWNAKPTESSS